MSKRGKTPKMGEIPRFRGWLCSKAFFGRYICTSLPLDHVHHRFPDGDWRLLSHRILWAWHGSCNNKM